MSAPKASHVRPTGGLDHPVFEEMDESSHLIAIIGFARELTSDESERLDARIEAWEDSVEPSGDLYTEDKYVGPWNVYMRIQNLEDPRAAMVVLLDQLGDLPIQELLFARWGTPPDTEVMAPLNDPAMYDAEIQARFDDWDDYWQTVWNPKAPRPAPENSFYLRGVVLEDDGSIAALEERHMPMWYADVDLCLGALGTQADYAKPDARAKEIRAAIEAALGARFGVAGLTAPTLRMRDGSPGLERASYEGRSGYAFAIHYGQLTHRFSPSRVRFREPEVMDALRDVVKDKGLAPVILWHRYANLIPMTPLGAPTVLVINLFEPGLAKAPAPKAAKKPAAKKPAAKKPAAKKPAAKKPAAKKPAAKKRR